MKSSNRFARIVFLLIIPLALSGAAGCSTTTVSEAPVIGVDYSVVRVLYATDRNKTESTKPDEVYGGRRGELSYGYCDVSIPRDHRMGELESPRGLLDFFFPEDPSKHVMLLEVTPDEKENFYANLGARVRASDKDSAFLFVHGFNTTFEDAARRTAQMSYDLTFDGASVFYSWPSEGKATAYTVDEQNVAWAEANLRNFFEEFVTRSEAENIYVIAHSMGNRAVTRALSSFMAERPDLKSRIKEVILTAPDIDADVFKRDIAPQLIAAGQPITLYSSSNDLALTASRKIHGYPRAGDSGKGIVVLPGIETVDATGMDTGFLGHSYFAETRSVLADLYGLINEGRRPEERFGLREVESPAGSFWAFKK
jgi:esterase/lipase superfamily enzyme